MEHKEQGSDLPGFSHARKALEWFVFNSKWLLNIFYFGLICVLGLYGIAFTREVFEILTNHYNDTASSLLMVVLEAVDVVMIANLVKMIVTGSYNSFVNKYHGYPGENISAGMLKVNMSKSIIGVSSIHLLQTFIDKGPVDWDQVNKQLAIHGMFMVGALIMGYMEHLHVLGEVAEKNSEKEEKHEPA